MMAMMVRSSAAAKPPNIIVVLTDDQDYLLGSLDIMATLQREFVQGGTTFDNMYVTTPVCCPSRTSTLSSRYAHHLDDQGLGWCGDFPAMYENSSFVLNLKALNYTTALFGKYYNSYGDFCDANVHVPRGYDEFFAMCDDSHFFGNIFNNNGTMLKVSNTTYMTAEIGNRSIAWLSDALRGAAPVYAYIAPHAPHVPATPAPWYDNAPLPSELAPRTPNWGVASPEKHWLVASRPPLDAVMTNYSDELYARRLRTLLSVDDILTDLFALLNATGTADNTYVLYTSDHGYNLGQFRLPSGKFHTYENDIRVPLLVRGPGVARGGAVDAVVSNLDIVPTVLALAGAAPVPSDGASLAGFLGAAPTPASWRDRLLIEYWGLGYVWRGPCTNGSGECPHGPEALLDAPSNTYVALRVHNASTNALYADFRPRDAGPYAAAANWTEVYNITADPWQMDNVWRSAPPVWVGALRDELYALVNCSLSSCP